MRAGRGSPWLSDGLTRRYCRAIILIAVKIGIYSLLRIILIMRSYFYTYRGKCIRDWSNSAGLLQAVLNQSFPGCIRYHKAPAHPAARAEKSHGAGYCMRCPSAHLPGATSSWGSGKRGGGLCNTPYMYTTHTLRALLEMQGAQGALERLSYRAQQFQGRAGRINLDKLDKDRVIIYART